MSMPPLSRVPGGTVTLRTNRNYLVATAFVDELARAGARHAVLCPGSRSTPLTMTFAADQRFRCWSLIDERSAGFFALGIAKATGTPAAVVCTSGTAAANLLPAVAEACNSHTPLIVLTADRPPELRDTGANQTIDQLKIYGSLVRWFVEVGTPQVSVDFAAYVRSLGSRAVAGAFGPPAGPVHLNFAFQDPLVPQQVPTDFPAGLDLDQPEFAGRPEGRPWLSVARPAGVPEGEMVDALAHDVATHPRGVILAGAMTQVDRRLHDAVADFARAAGYPVLAEPLSGLRWGPHDRSLVIAHYDALLRDARFADDHRPQVAIRLGAITTSKIAPNWLDAVGCRQIVFDPDRALSDPGRRTSTFLQADPAATLEAVAVRLTADERSVGAQFIAPAPAPSGATRNADTWASAWIEADRTAAAALASHQASLGELFEGAVAAELGEALFDGATLFVAPSMPIRDIEAFLPSDGRDARFLANRGANGIDGVVSSALGAAAAGDRSVYLLIGDVALLHDIGGLFAAKRHRLPIVIVVVNNNGGGIFSFLPQAAYPEHFEEFFTTPHDIDLGQVAALYDMGYRLVNRPGRLAAAVREAAGEGGAQLVEARIPSIERNVAEHRRAWEAVARALEAERAGPRPPHLQP